MYIYISNQFDVWAYQKMDENGVYSIHVRVMGTGMIDQQMCGLYRAIPFLEPMWV